MPEFVLEGRDHSARQESEFVHGYIEAMFFTESASGADMADWWNDETQEDLREGRLDGNIPGDCGYCELHPSALEAIRAQCLDFQTKAADLLALAYSAHWQRAAMREGWTRNAHNGFFVGPIGHETRMADFESWQELCESEGIEPGESYDETQAGRDFWFTRNGHGVGFWARDALDVDGLGDKLAALCGWKTEFGETNPWFGGHVENGNAPFVYHD